MAKCDILLLLAHHIKKNKQKLANRLIKNLATDGECVIWTGTVNNSGYGLINFWFCGHVQVKVHRLFFVLANKRNIEDWEEIDHTCGNRLCVRHLEAVTKNENLNRRNIRQGWNGQ